MCKQILYRTLGVGAASEQLVHRGSHHRVQRIDADHLMHQADSERLRRRNARARQRQAPSLTLAQRIHQVGPNHRWQNAKFCLTDGE